MVNHARTLLINMSAATAGAASGLAYADYIEPGFIPSTNPVLLRYRQLFAPLTTGDTAARLRAFAALVPILHGPGLERWVSKHDARVTYLDSARLVSASGVVPALLARLVAVDMSSLLIELQYTASRIDPDLAGLIQAPDAITRLGAALLAYVDVHESLRGSA